jgi:murein DD-endopeptidase MepM/ murein hydrolase activator NlpD
MTKSKLGCHWIRTHPDGNDYAHIEAMQYKSVKLFEWHWNNRDACNDLLAALPGNSYLVARDHPMSEQKQDMYRDPVGTGQRHANEWAEKVHSGRVHLPTDRTFFLGINEPDATTGDRHAIDRYTAIFLSRLREHGLRGGAFNFSTGHPRTVDGTGNTAPDYTVFEESHQAIVYGHHIAVAHIYGSSTQACVPGHYDRLKSCKWQDVEWIIGEMGSDEHVTSGGAHDGYLRTMNPPDYCAWIDDLIIGIADSRIHSYQIFTYDFSHPWDSFDIRPIRGALESNRWDHMHVLPTPPIPPIEPPFPPIPPPSGQDGEIEAGIVIAPAGLNLRKGPGTEFPVLGTLGMGSTVLHDEELAGWLHVTDGWVSGEYVGDAAATILSPALPPPPFIPGGIVHPLPGAVITRNFYEESDDYLQFGFRAHNGTDFGGMAQGTSILAMADGVVTRVEYDAPGYGHFVMIAHDQKGAYTMYCHASEVLVPVGKVVSAAEPIALLGSTGNSSGPHLHTETRLMNADGSYREGTPMSKGRVDVRTWAAMYGLKL